MIDAEHHALAELDQFIREWIGPVPARLVWCTGNNAAERVRAAIHALAEQHKQTASIGFAVFSQYRDPYDERRDGFGYSIASNVFDEPPTDALTYCAQKWPKDHFVIGAIQQIG